MKVTLEIQNALREAREAIRNEKPFICHSLMDALAMPRFAPLKPPIVRFIEDGIVPRGGHKTENPTFVTWLLDQECCTIFGSQFDDVVMLGREAWLSKLLYLIEERGAIELYPNGTYMDRLGYLINANGTRSIFCDVDE
jgi:hypothetical protein